MGVEIILDCILSPRCGQWNNEVEVANTGNVGISILAALFSDKKIEHAKQLLYALVSFLPALFFSLGGGEHFTNLRWVTLTPTKNTSGWDQ